MIRLTQEQLNRFTMYKAVFDKAHKVTGVPRYVLFAIWYRERSLMTASNPWQFDTKVTPMNSTRRRFLFGRYSTLTQLETDKYVAAGIDNFEAATILAACFLKDKGAKFVTDDDIKDAFWSYNGRSYGSADRSPYVMNDFDAAHENMPIHGTIDGKPLPPGTVDHQAGAFTVYKQMQEVFGEETA